MSEWLYFSDTKSDFKHQDAKFVNTPQEQSDPHYNEWLNRKEVVSREDSYLNGGLTNVAANIGTPQDLSSFDYRSSPGYINQTYFTTFYRTSILAKRILDLLTNDVYGKGPHFIKVETKEAEKLRKLWKDRAYNNLLRKALRQMLLHGGCAFFIRTQLRENWALPLEEDELKHHFERFVFIDKSLMYPTNFYSSSSKSFLDLDEPKSWTIIQPNGDSNFEEIHKSRFIRFLPEKLPFFANIMDLWWGDSIFTQTKREIDAIERAFHSSSNLICQSTVRFLKTDIRTYAKDNEQLNALKGDSFGKSLRSQMLSQNYSAHVLAKDDDVLSLEVKNLRDQSELLKTLVRYVISPYGIPETRFWGSSPSGFGSGDSELMQWYEEVDEKREAFLRTPLQRFLNVLSVTESLPPIDFEFTPINEPNEVQLSDIAVQQAQTAKLYYEMGLPLETIIPQLQQSGAFHDMTTEQAVSLGKKIDRKTATEQKNALEQKELKTERHSPGLPTDKLSTAKPDSVSRVKIRE